ncbi:mitochondrial hypoxia responsive domain-containing protein [Biscogniauxia marginata]|nr:mitochondrial hypoxia responsive domain-containing protein [Biscogniauxia marginata]
MSDRPMPSSFDDDSEYNETGFQKVSRKLREEPLIPLGTVLTCVALYNAWRAMSRGDHAQVQRMFRARIGAQAFTVMAMVAGGAYYGADREKRRELVKLEAQQRAEDRHQRWLRELEVRDEEDKQIQAVMRRKRERLEQRRADEKARAKAKENEGAAVDATASSSSSSSSGSSQGQEDPKADGQVSPQEKKPGSSVMGALSEAGGWFGSKKGEGLKPAEEKKPEERKPEAETPKK